LAFENWEKIRFFPNYWVSSFGRVCRYDKVNDRLKMLKPTDKRGYWYVTLYNKSGRKARPIHRLVALSFIRRERDATTVNHLDGNRHNNAVDNLEWTTRSGNVKHAWQTGLHARKHK
jgi:hypothetical protein